MVSSTDDVGMMEYLSKVAAVSAEGVVPPMNRPPEAGEEQSGASFQFEKKGSTVRLNGLELPDRIPVRTRDGRWSPISPTMLFKRVNGRRVFFAPDEYDRLVESGELIPPPAPRFIAEMCDICNRRRALEGLPERRFESLAQYRAHMNGFHSDEYRDQREDQRDREQRESNSMMRDLIQAATGKQYEAPQVDMPMVYYCDVEGCDRFFDGEQAVSMHKRTGHKS